MSEQSLAQEQKIPELNDVQSRLNHTQMERVVAPATSSVHICLKMATCWPARSGGLPSSR